MTAQNRPADEARDDTPMTARRLAITRLHDGTANYELADVDSPPTSVLARVNWLNVEGVPCAFGGSADDCVTEFGGQAIAHVELSNEGEPAPDGVRRAAGARITFEVEA